MYIISNTIMILLTLISVLVAVAFLTLLERKLLSYIQLRKGPNKISLMGILQPFSDAIKLFTKESFFPHSALSFTYYLSPLCNLTLALFIWVIYPTSWNQLDWDFPLLFFMACASLNVYPILSAGWSSNSKYASLGSLRAVSQMISYEVSLFLILLTLILLNNSFTLLNFFVMQSPIMNMIFLSPLALMWLCSSLAEANRTPFDLAESESELVSGFNIEYSSSGFAMIFMAEYTSIIFLSLLFSVMFMSPATLNLFLETTIMASIFIWVRGTLPRFRYDKLMNLAWTSFLPISLTLIFISLLMKLLSENNLN